MESDEELMVLCQPIGDCFDWNYPTIADNSPFDAVTDETLIATDETLLVPGTDLYKKARKRRQNRESAARTRLRRRKQQEQADKDMVKITDLNNALSIENTALRSENKQLKEEIEYYKSLLFTKH